MTIKDALDRFIFNELECGETICGDCPYHDRHSSDCCLSLTTAAQTVKEWLGTLPEGHLLNITLEDLL